MTTPNTHALDALRDIERQLRAAGADLPAPQVAGTIESSMNTGLCIALALVTEKIAALTPSRADTAGACMHEWAPTNHPDWIQKCAKCALFSDERIRTAPAGDARGAVDGFVQGVNAAIAWVEKRRHDYEAEYGSVDYSTNAVEFGNFRREEYHAELCEIEEGLRREVAAAPTPATPSGSQAGEVIRLAREVVDMQERLAGNGSSTHMALHDLARDLRKALAWRNEEKIRGR